MRVKIDGSSTIRAPQTIVFDFLIDPKKVAGCFQDIQSIEILDPETFRAKIKTGISYIKGTFDFEFKISEKNSPIKATLKGKGTGRGSVIDLDTRIELNEMGAGATKVIWDSEVRISGTIAAAGARILEMAAGKLITLLFMNIRNELEK